jgi:hypothetical protein
MDRAGNAPDPSASGMGTVKMSAATVLAVADRLLDIADRLDGMRWPAPSSAATAGSAVEASTTADPVEDLVADVVAHVRALAISAKATAAIVERSRWRHAGRLDGPR